MPILPAVVALNENSKVGLFWSLNYIFIHSKNTPDIKLILLWNFQIKPYKRNLHTLSHSREQYLMGLQTNMPSRDYLEGKKTLRNVFFTYKQLWKPLPKTLYSTSIQCVNVESWEVPAFPNGLFDVSYLVVRWTGLCNLEHQSQGLGATSGSLNDLRSCTNGWHEANYSMLINKDWTLLWTVRITLRFTARN